MYHYLFTNDLRITNLQNMLIATSRAYITDTVPSSDVDKSMNNNMTTLSFYFNLTKESNCSFVCSEGNVRKVVYNFIKKFQFPNPRTQESWNNAINDNITVAPMRLIIQLLYYLNLTSPEAAHLSREEILDFIFYNSDVAKVKRTNIVKLANQILEFRRTGILPNTIEKDSDKRNWKQEERQIREMTKVLTWSGCVSENDNNELIMVHDKLTQENKAAIYDILNYNIIWSTSDEDFKNVLEGYRTYMDISDADINNEVLENEENQNVIDCLKYNIGEEDFVQWMSESDLAPGMQIQYHYLLKSIPSSLGYEDVFSKKNVSDFMEYFERIKRDSFYKDAVPSVGAGALRSALKKYGRYLEARTIGIFTQDELVQILKKWHAGKPVEGNVTSSLIGFGLKYGASIQAGQIKSKELLASAGIDATIWPYVDRGVDLYETIKKGDIGLVFSDGETADLLSDEKHICYETHIKTMYDWNRIIFGAPGTGKSFILEKDKDDFVAAGGEYERVTFHPDYSYAQFVGTYKPRMNSNGDIEYAYIPGPFMRSLIKAYKSGMTSTPHPVLLLIEEINRANMAAVFGDVFQLLDRENGVSQYPIQASEDIRKYIKDEIGIEAESIKLPDNLYIWATMNSADQGVFPMDTAFKRRWNFEYIGIDDRDADIRGKYVFLKDDQSQKVEWNKLRKAINYFLAKENINEDKQLGPYFLSRNIVIPEDGDEIDREQFIDAFKNKVIMYLFEDAAKQKRPRLFEGCSKTGMRYSEICKEFDVKGIEIFNSSILKDAEPENISQQISI